MGINAFIFPGQGSQYPGMGKELAENFRIAADVFQEADDTLGWKLSQLCFEGPEEDLKLRGEGDRPGRQDTLLSAYSHRDHSRAGPRHGRA